MSAWARVCLRGVVLRVGLFVSGIVAVGAVHRGGSALVQGCASAKGCGVCVRAILHGAVFCVWAEARRARWGWRWTECSRGSHNRRRATKARAGCDGVRAQSAEQWGGGEEEGRRRGGDFILRPLSALETQLRHGSWHLPAPGAGDKGCRTLLGRGSCLRPGGSWS